MSKYNILIPFSNAIDPTTGGVERVYHNLVPTLRSYGCNVYATYNVESVYDESSVYTECYYLGDISMNDQRYRKKWAEIIHDKEINIVPHLRCGVCRRQLPDEHSQVCGRQWRQRAALFL